MYLIYNEDVNEKLECITTCATNELPFLQKVNEFQCLGLLSQKLYTRF